jgi:hypothetical protein
MLAHCPSAEVCFHNRHAGKSAGTPKIKMSATAYPLQWPKAWPKTEIKQDSRFKQTLSAALNKLKRECQMLGGKELVLSSNYTLGTEHPKESGVVAYFHLDQKPIAIPCDRWRAVEDNVYAIAMTIEAMRGMERWGAKHMITAMFSGFKALPEKAGGKDPYLVLGILPGAKVNAETITAAYKQKAKTAHPDAGGSAEAWAELREAHDLLMQNVRHQ